MKERLFDPDDIGTLVESASLAKCSMIWIAVHDRRCESVVVVPDDLDNTDSAARMVDIVADRMAILALKGDYKDAD